MQTAVLTVELIFFILATLLMGYLTIKTIVSDIKERKQRKQLDNALSQFCDKLTTANILSIFTAGIDHAFKHCKNVKINYYRP